MKVGRPLFFFLAPLYTVYIQGSEMNASLLVLLCLVGFIHAAFTSFQSSGNFASDIQTSVNTFRDEIGGTTPVPGGGFNDGMGGPTVRFEINWDAVPATSCDPFVFPLDFFASDAVPKARGLEMSVPGSGEARVSGM